MSKKTKKEKLRSQERKKRLLLAQYKDTGSESRAVTLTKTVNPHREQDKEIVTPQHVLSQQEIIARRYFFEDFKKSAILVACVIALEIAVYYGTMNSYLARLIGFGH